MGDEPVRRLTVSEFIRESKPDWEHVRVRDRRASTGRFSGCAQVHVAAPESFEEQLADFEAGRNDAFYNETERFVDDLQSLDQEAVVVAKVRRTPR